MDKVFSDHLLAILPPGARAKAAYLEDRFILAMDAIKAAGDREYEGQRDIAQRRWKLKEALAKPLPRVPTEADNAADDRLRAKLDACEAEWQTYKRRTTAAQEMNSGVEVVVEVKQWLQGRRGGGFTGYDTAPRTIFRDAPFKKEIVGDPRAEIDKARSEIAEIDAEWQRLVEAPSTSEELTASALAAVSAIADRGRPSLKLGARAGDPFSLAKTFNGDFLGDGRAVGGAGAHFLVWLLRDVIEARLVAEIGPDVPGAISYDAREKRFADLAARKLDLERREEAAIVAAEAAGMSAKRRRDADPRAVLEIAEID